MTVKVDNNKTIYEYKFYMYYEILGHDGGKGVAITTLDSTISPNNIRIMDDQTYNKLIAAIANKFSCENTDVFLVNTETVYVGISVATE